jgi:hypothetical protein
MPNPKMEVDVVSFVPDLLKFKATFFILTEVETPLLLRFKCTPRAILILFLKLQAIIINFWLLIFYKVKNRVVVVNISTGFRKSCQGYISFLLDQKK